MRALMTITSKPGRLLEASIQQARWALTRKLDALSKLSDDGREESEDHRELIDALGRLDELRLDDAGNLYIYRYMMVTSEWLRDAGSSTSLGVYWASTPTLPLGMLQATKGHVLALLVGLLAPEQQDWDTIESLQHVGEDEVRLDAGTPVTIVQVMVDGEEQDLPNLTGQTLHA